ncbi:MAG: hypothetical protein IJ501_04925 [Bacilli bacterium]|nr:hypothetical protein [Bacilli bacterium]
MKKKTKTLILSIVVTLVLILTFMISYAAFVYRQTGENNQQLVLGDIYMHYNETTTTIDIDNMIPMSKLSVNTSDEKVTLCVNYLYNTYGAEWNGLYGDLVQDQFNNYSNITGSFMANDATYTNYCGGGIIKIYPAPSSSSKNEYVVRPINEFAEPIEAVVPIRTTQILTDFENGVLTEIDKAYFLENEIIIDNIKNLEYFEFLVSGKNTNTKGSILYSIQLAEGEEPVQEGESILNRIEPSFLRFRLTEVNGDEETILKDNQVFDSFENANLYTSIISKNTTNKINKTYRLYMWIDDSVVIGNTSEANYSMEEWNSLYASVKVNVNGKYVKAEPLSEKVKSKLGSEGVVAVNTDGDLYDGTGEIREYRYSGIGNYCTYTDGENDYNMSVEGETCPTSVCQIAALAGNAIFSNTSDGVLLYGSCADNDGTELPLKVEGSTPIDSGLRNYVEFNGELWRIVGVFGDNVKIVKDTPLTNDIYNEETYTSGETTYELKFTTEGTKYGYFIYNYPTEGYQGTNLNDWTNSGAMHYLNDETGNSYYANNLSTEAKSMLEQATYNLGNVSVDNDMWFVSGTAKEVYEQERGTVICGSNVTSWSNENNCNIWNGNQPTWTGEIGLLYPSDFGYASNSNNWSTNMGDYYHNGGSLNNWMFNTDTAFTWFLSPSAYIPYYVLVSGNYGNVGDDYANRNGSLRPVLNLKSQVMTTGGDGSYSTPYTLIIE